MYQNLPANKLILGITLAFVCIFFLSFAVSPAKAATTYVKQYYDSPPAFSTTCLNQSGCGTPDDCWNSERTGVTDCGLACDGGNAWIKYSEYGCFQTAYNPFSGDEQCTIAFTKSSDTYSTGDKYNSSNPPVMNAGKCDTNVGGPYKTCCNGASLANARPFPVDPYAPDEADCGGYTTVRCGGGGEPACGAPACANNGSQSSSE